MTMSTYSRPSTSKSRDPWPEAIKRGYPPTAPNARTGLLTPPGRTAWAVSKSASDAATGPLVTIGAPRDTGASIHLRYRFPATAYPTTHAHLPFAPGEPVSPR